MSKRHLIERFAAVYHIEATEGAILQLANTHPYKCTCDVCLFWWAAVGADEDGKYGPFAPQEVALARLEYDGKL